MKINSMEEELDRELEKHQDLEVKDLRESSHKHRRKEKQK